MNYNYKICIIGLGFVGNAMYNSFINKGLEENVNLFGYDKYKGGGIGKISNGLVSDIVFLVLPTMFDEISGSYDKTSIIECCEYLEENNYKGIVVIKSTVEPETTDNISNKFPSLFILHNPEFLTARTAYEDFHNQTHIVIGKSKLCTEEKVDMLKNFYLTFYPDAEISICTSIESESMKIFCNSYYAVKIQLFTELYLLTKSNGSEFDKIVQMMIKNKWINPAHTKIPGPDGIISYGGMCFPKDTNALNKYMEKNHIPHEILNSCIKERNQMRNDSCNIIKNNLREKIEKDVEIDIENTIQNKIFILTKK